MRRIGSWIGTLALTVSVAGSAWAQATIGETRTPEPADPDEADPGRAEEIVDGITTPIHDVKPAEIRAAVDEGDYPKALRLIRQALAQEPENESEFRLLEARALNHVEEPRAAAEVYIRILDDPVVGRKARGELHDLYVRRGRFRSADRLTDEATNLGPEADPELVRMRAFSMTIQGRYGEAARLVSDLAVSGDAGAQVLRANALLVLGEHDAAEELFLDVLDREPEKQIRQIAHYGLGQVARLKGGRAVRALQDEKAVMIGPSPLAELDWALALRALGRRAEARTRLERISENYSRLAPTARLVLARLAEEEGSANEGLDHLAGALDGGFGDFLALTRLGELLVQEGLEEEGIEAYYEALELFPDFPVAREQLTRALTRRGGAGRRRRPSRRKRRSGIFRAGPGNASWTGTFRITRSSRTGTRCRWGRLGRAVLALVQLRAGHPAGALGWSDGARPPDQIFLSGIRAEALEEVGRYEEAEELWKAILATDVDWPHAKVRLAHLMMEKDPQRALELWREYFAENPQNSRARIRMAEAFEDDGQWAEAKEAYEKAELGSWLSPEERSRVRVAIEDLADLIREREERLED